MKTLIALRKSVSEHGDPTKQVGYYFSEALYSRLSIPVEKSMTMVQTTSEDFMLTYKALKDACPLPEIKTEESLGFRRGTRFWIFFFSIFITFAIGEVGSSNCRSHQIVAIERLKAFRITCWCHSLAICCDSSFLVLGEGLKCSFFLFSFLQTFF